MAKKRDCPKEEKREKGKGKRGRWTLHTQPSLMHWNLVTRAFPSVIGFVHPRRISSWRTRNFIDSSRSRVRSSPRDFSLLIPLIGEVYRWGFVEKVYHPPGAKIKVRDNLMYRGWNVGGIGKSLARLLLAMENLSGRNLLAFGANVICSFFFSFFFARDNGREISRYPFVFETINFYGNIFQPVYSRCYPLSIALIDAQSFEKWDFRTKKNFRENIPSSFWQRTRNVITRTLVLLFFFDDLTHN